MKLKMKLRATFHFTHSFLHTHHTATHGNEIIVLHNDNGMNVQSDRFFCTFFLNSRCTLNQLFDYWMDVFRMWQ